MSLIILLFAIGLILLAAEVIVPGGILGGIAALMMLGGCAVAYSRFGANGGMIALIAAIALICITLFLEFRVLPKTRMGRRAFLESEIGATSAAFGPEAQQLIGSQAEAITLLSPTGYIRVNGKRYEGFSQSGQISPGATLQVVGADNFRLIVTSTPTPE
ncbi:MAG: NfeD family protein [Luteolibacter sp.]